MADETMSRYAAACAKACHWCAKGLRVTTSFPSRRTHWHFENKGEPTEVYCTAFTEADFAESESVRAEEMAAYAARQTNAAIAAGAPWTDAAARADALQQKYDRLDRELCATIILAPNFSV